LYTGAVSGDSVTLTSQPVSGGSSGVTISGTVLYGTNFSGDFQVTGAKQSDNCYGVTGMVYGLYIPPLTGTWIGNLNENTYSQYDQNGIPIPNSIVTTNVDPVTVNIVQADLPVSMTSGSMEVFPLSGTVIFSSSNCYTTGTIDGTKSYISGVSYSLVVDTDTGGILKTSGNLDATHPQTLNFGTASGPIVVPSGVCQYTQVSGPIDEQLLQNQ
jgi:hypothetical protein